MSVVRGWELVRCRECGYEHVRPSEGRRVLPCSRCQGPMALLTLRASDDEELRAPAADGFSLSDAKTSLEWAAVRARARAIDSENPLLRLRLEGLREGFETALMMLAAAGVAGRPPVSAADPLRAPTETSETAEC